MLRGSCDGASSTARSLTIQLTAEEIAYMEAPYAPHAIVGHS